MAPARSFAATLSAREPKTAATASGTAAEVAGTAAATGRKPPPIVLQTARFAATVFAPAQNRPWLAQPTAPLAATRSARDPKTAATVPGTAAAVAGTAAAPAVKTL